MLRKARDVLIGCIAVFRILRENKHLIDESIRDELFLGIDQTERECTDLVDEIEHDDKFSDN